jgi:hypothetical protein
MKISSERAKAIDAYLADHDDAEKGKWPLEISGEKQILPFYRLPINIELLCYNVSNGRLAMDVRDWEVKNCRKLDAACKEDSQIIREMLLALDKGATEMLKEDIRKKSQMEPGVITHDGFVVNGNRRMAVLEALHDEEPTGKWSFLEAVRLPFGISEKDLWKIEAGLQLSKDKIAEYHPVNELLKIKQGIDANLTIDEIAAAMYGRKVDEVKGALARLEIIDNFLSFFKQPANYGLIRQFGLHEYFIDIQNHVMSTWERRAVPKLQRQQELLAGFELIAAHIRIQKLAAGKKKEKGITHWDIRKLGKILADVNARDAYMRNLKDHGKKPLSVKPSTLIEDFRSAEEVLAMKEQKDQPVRLIERAIKALESIDRSNKHFQTTEVRDAIDKLASVVESMKKDLSK